MKFTRDEIRASMLLYAVTDRAWLGGRTLPDVVEEVLAQDGDLVSFGQNLIRYREG